MAVEIENVTRDNVDSTGFFCYMSKRKTPGWKEKRDWLSDHLGDSFFLKKLKLPNRGFIEYADVEASFKPVVADGYVVIHCIWVVGKSKGKGYASELLAECVSDAKKRKAKGVAMVVSDIGYMKWKGFLLRSGFELVDSAPNSYELMALKFGTSTAPRFSGGWEKKSAACGNGVTILSSGQCPYFHGVTEDLLGASRAKEIEPKIIWLASHDDVVKKAPTPYGTYSVVINGKAVPIFYDAKKIIEAL